MITRPVRLLEGLPPSRPRISVGHYITGGTPVADGGVSAEGVAHGSVVCQQPGCGAESDIAPLIHFAKKPKPYLDCIVSPACYRLHTFRLEGMNNKI